MQVSISLNPIELNPSVEEVARYFGGPQYAPDAGVRCKVISAIEQASEWVAPVVVYALYPLVGLRDDGTLHLENGFRLSVPSFARDPHARYLAVVVGSLGKELETRCRNLAHHKQTYQSTLLDAVGTAMLDLLDARSRCLLDEHARKMELFRGTRFSPGLDEYPLEQQQALFRLVDGAFAGVSLNESCIMEPAKSVSFFRLFSSVENDGDPSSKCRRCRMIRCRFRVVM